MDLLDFNFMDTMNVQNAKEVLFLIEENNKLNKKNKQLQEVIVILQEELEFYKQKAENES